MHARFWASKMSRYIRFVVKADVVKSNVYCIHGEKTITNQMEPPNVLFACMLSTLGIVFTQSNYLPLQFLEFTRLILVIYNSYKGVAGNRINEYLCVI